MQTRKRWRKVALIAIAWAAVVAWSLAIFALSSQPGDPGAGGGRLRLSWQKGAHFVVFAVLAVGIANALTVSGVRSRRFWWTFVLCAMYAVTDELHQVVVPFRNPNIIDVIIDMAGASTGFLVYGRLLRLEVPMRARVAVRDARRQRPIPIRDGRVGGRLR